MRGGRGRGAGVRGRSSKVSQETHVAGHSGDTVQQIALGLTFSVKNGSGKDDWAKELLSYDIYLLDSIGLIVGRIYP